MALILIVTLLLFRDTASTSLITSYGNTTAAYGRDAHYRCEVANPEGVLQVTWQRQYKDSSVKSLATYSTRFGQQVNEPYQDKVIFTEASLNSTSITLKNVTWEDDSCYICSFNFYPDGSKRKQTCLTVQGISEVTTGVQSASSENEAEGMKEFVFSCSATGKPAPTIEWAFSPQALPLNQTWTTTEANSDHTFSSSRNITLQIPSDWSGHVDCLLNSGITGERRERIPFDRGGKGTKEEGKALSAGWATFAICAVIICVSCMVIAAAVKRKRMKSQRESEMCDRAVGLSCECSSIQAPQNIKFLHSHTLVECTSELS